MKKWEERLEYLFFKYPDLDRKQLKQHLLFLSKTSCFSIDELVESLLSLYEELKEKNEQNVERIITGQN